MKTIFFIGLGSFLGGVFRYLISLFVQSKITSIFPAGTLLINIIGCFFIGVVFSLAGKGNISEEWKLFLATGLLGGFTTFSAFSIETINLLKSGDIGYALIYISLSVVLGLFATYIGMHLFKLF